MRVLFEKKTRRIIEAQSGGDDRHLDVLYANAKSMGYARSAVEAKVVPDDEFAALLAAQKESELTYAQRRRAEYPSVGDQLDALYKAGLFPPEMAALIKAVKEKHPKPEEA